jgi:hypothetical protein
VREAGDVVRQSDQPFGDDVEDGGDRRQARDIIAVPGNPLTDITVTEHVSFVMKEGAIIKR